MRVGHKSHKVKDGFNGTQVTIIDKIEQDNQIPSVESQENKAEL